MEPGLQEQRDSEYPYVSTGHLPTPEQVNALVAEAYERYKANAEGEVSQVYPALARVPSDPFGICVVGASGNVYAIGHTDYPFSIMGQSAAAQTGGAASGGSGGRGLKPRPLVLSRGRR